MRGNGLRAESYRLIADVDPPAAEELLVVLREHGIAAYTADAGSDEREGEQDAEARLRLYADAEHAGRAAELCERRGPEHRDGGVPAGGEHTTGLADLDEEAAWSRIVAAYDDDPGDPVPRWPAAEDADPLDPADASDPAGSDESPTSDESSGSDRPAAADESGDREGSDRGTGDEHGGGPSVATRWATRGPAADDDLPPMRTTEESERFVPPTPPPLPRLDPVTKAAWIAVLGAPGLFVVAVALRIALPSWITGLVAAAFIGGMIALFLRLKSGPPDDTDDGAVV